jgi:DNA-binding NarL/FixJ family response regulator
MEAKTKVFILCSNRLLRESIARILAKKADFEIVAAQAISLVTPDEIAESGADVLVLDSLEFLVADPAWCSRTLVFSCSLKCVLVAMEADSSRFLTAVRRGARGYVLQDASAADVVSAIRTVAEGQAVCPPAYAQVLFECIARQAEELPNSRKRAQWGLTRREQQLIPLIGQGLSNKEIANHLSLSEQTVKNHIHRILRKVGVPDRLSVLEAYRNEYPLSARNSSTQLKYEPVTENPYPRNTE